MNGFEFYQNLDLKYPELAICIEDSLDGIAKFYIPVLTPILNSDNPYDISDINISRSNILNDSSSMNINSCTSSNYIELRLPDIEYFDSIKNKLITKKGSCSKGDIFVIVFISGDPNKPFILGRYYNAINN